MTQCSWPSVTINREERSELKHAQGTCEQVSAVLNKWVSTPEERASTLKSALWKSGESGGSASLPVPPEGNAPFCLGRGKV